MSYSDDPYASPQADSPLPKDYGARNTIDAMEALKFAFTAENWFVNLLLGLVCAIIPIVGPIVFLGYMMETIELLLKQPGAACPQIEFGRFGDLLKRGVWPFVGALIAQLVLLPLTLILMIPYFCLFFGSMPMLDSGDMEALGFLLLLAAFAYLFLAMIFVNAIGMCIVTPMMVGPGLAQEVGPALDFSFVKDFLARTWKDMLKAYMLFMVVGMFASILGYCALFIGLYFVIAWLWIAAAHMYYQAYALYLARGGKPIEQKPEFAG
mgnify:CR=1 FL=1